MFHALAQNHISIKVFWCKNRFVSIVDQNTLLLEMKVQTKRKTEFVKEMVSEMLRIMRNYL